MTVYETAALWAAQGWRIEALTPSAAVLVSVRRASRRFHLLNAVACLFTCGAWVFGWIALWATRRPRRVMITVDDAGTPTIVNL